MPLTSQLSRSSRPIQRVQSLHEQAYHALRTAILSGELAAGERLTELQLADLFQVSRTPIREAIRQLQREKLVVADANGALRVATLSIVDAAHLYDCRLALEQVAVAEACQKATSPHLEQIEQAVQQAETAIDPSSTHLAGFQLLHLDQQFHRTIAESTGNPWLVTLLDQVFDQMALLRIRTTQYNPRVLEVRQEHRRIFQAIARQQEDAAVQAIREHLTASKARVIAEIQHLERDQEKLK